MTFKSDVEAFDAFFEKYKSLKKEISKVIIGQDDIINNLIISHEEDSFRTRDYYEVML